MHTRFWSCRNSEDGREVAKEVTSGVKALLRTDKGFLPTGGEGEDILSIGEYQFYHELQSYNSSKN